MSATPTGSANPYSGILDIATAIVSTMSWQETLTVVAERIGQAMFAWSASINSYDAERHAVTYEAYWCQGGVTQEDLDYIGHVTYIEDRPDFKPLVEGKEVVEDRIDDPSLPATEREVMKKWGLKTTLDAPLLFDGRVIGTVGVAETRFVRRFTSTELDLFRQLCELASIGIHNAQEARRRTEMERRAGALAGLAAQIAGAESGAEVRTLLQATATQSLGASLATLAPADPGLTESVVQRIDDAALDDGVRAELERDAMSVRLLVPAVFRGQPQAVLSLSWADVRHQVAQADVESAATIAAEAAVALSHPAFAAD